MSLNNPPIKQRFASYGGALLILAVVFTCKTVSYAIDDATLLRHVIDRLDQDWISPSMWGTGAVLAWAAMISRSERLAAIAFGVAAMLLILWGVLALWTGPDNFLSSGIVYLGLLAMSLWGVTRTQIPLKEMNAERKKGHRGEL